MRVFRFLRQLLLFPEIEGKKKKPCSINYKAF